MKIEVTKVDVEAESRKRNCVNCRHNIRTGELGFSECHCEIDGHYIGYVQCFEGWCRRYAKERNR